MIICQKGPSFFKGCRKDLFLAHFLKMYVNGLPLVCKDLFPLLFVHDTNLIALHEDFTALLGNVNTKLAHFLKWCQLNKPLFNFKMTNFYNKNSPQDSRYL